MYLNDIDITVLNNFHDIVSGKDYNHEKFIEDIKLCSIQTISDVESELNSILTKTNNVDNHYLDLATIHLEVTNYLNTLTEDGICYC